MKFTIRDLLWLMVTVALATALCMDRIQMRRTVARYNEASERQALRTAREQAKLQTAVEELTAQKMTLKHQLDRLAELSGSQRGKNP